MPNQFGGIPVTPAGNNQFGGIPIKQASAPALARESAEQLVAEIEKREGIQFEPQAREQAIRDAMTHGMDIAGPKPFQNSVGRIPKPNPNAEGADPTEGMSWLEKAAAGYGKSYVDTYRGLQQVGGRIGGAIGLDTAERLAQVDDAVNESRRTDAALMDTGAGIAGNVVGQAVQMLTPVPAAAAAKGVQVLGRAAPYAGAAARSAAFSGAQGVADGESRALNTAVGGGLGIAGQGLATGTRALATRAGAAVDPMKAAAIKQLEKLGIPVHLSQTMDSGFLKLVSSVVNKLPFSGVQKAGRAQQDALNAELGKMMGLQGVRRLTDDVMDTAARRQSQAYDALFARNTVKLNPIVIGDLKTVAHAARSDLPPDKAQVVINQIEKFVNGANARGEIPGRLYQNLRLGLKPLESHPEHGHLVKQVRKAMEQAADDSFGGADAKILKETNARYANRKIVEKALKQVTGAGGDVRPAALWPLANQKFGSTPEMRELARAGQLVMKDGIPDSGTSQRELINRLLGLGPAGTAAVLGGVPLALKAMGAGAVVGRALNSQAAAKVAPHLAPAAKKAAAAAAKPAPVLFPALAPLWLRQDDQP